MANRDRSSTFQTKRRSLSREITYALLAKLILLSILWFLIFRGPNTGGPDSDTASLFGLPAAGTARP